MRIVINLLLLALICFLTYLLFTAINEPIQFQAERDKREVAVRQQLEKIREAQKAYRAIKGVYAPTFDTLRLVLNTDSFKIVKVFGDPDSKEKDKVSYETVYVNAKDSIARTGIELDNIELVPYGDGEKFKMEAMLIEYQATEVPVMEAGVTIAKYMGKYAGNYDKKSNKYRSRYMRYDDSYKPGEVRKFGDLTKPTLAGNW